MHSSPVRRSRDGHRGRPTEAVTDPLRFNRKPSDSLADRVVHALDTRLTLALHVAEATARAEVHPSDRVF